MTEKRAFVTSTCDRRKKDIYNTLEKCGYRFTSNWEKCEIIVVDLCECPLVNFRVYFSNERSHIFVQNSIGYPPVVFLDQCKNKCNGTKKKKITFLKKLIPELIIIDNIENLEKFIKWLDRFVPRTKPPEFDDRNYERLINLVINFIKNLPP